MICRWILLERKQLSSRLSRCQGFIPDHNQGSAADSMIYGRKRNKSQPCFHVLVHSSKRFAVGTACELLLPIPALLEGAEQD